MSSTHGPVCHGFAVVVHRHPTEQDWDWLGDVTNDAGWTVPRDDSPAYAEFDRTGADLAAAIASAIYDLAAAGFHATRVRPVGLVLDAEIPDRVGLSWPEIDRRIGRSPHLHPKPSTDPLGFRAWPEIARWLDAHGVAQSYDLTIQAADELVVAGLTARSEGDLAQEIRRGIVRLKRGRAGVAG